MKVVRYSESLSQPGDTMFIEIDSIYRFTRRGKDWAKFRTDLVEVIKETISDEFSEAFAKETEGWESTE